MNKWIKCSKRLPKQSGYYLCTYIFDNHRFYYDRWFDIDRKNEFEHGFQTTDNVTHWMDLPEGPLP